MGQAGLTRGAFYAYFESKSDLYAEILGCFFTDPNWKSQWEGIDVDLASPQAGPQIVRAYLSQQHFDDVENSCPMVALPSDVARCDPKVKAAFENVFRAMVTVLGRDVKHSMQTPEDTAMAIAALCIGGRGTLTEGQQIQRSPSRRGDTCRPGSGRLERRCHNFAEHQPLSKLSGCSEAKA
jgi:AcrR family transcriptional regulator